MEVLEISSYLYDDTNVITDSLKELNEYKDSYKYLVVCVVPNFTSSLKDIVCLSTLKKLYLHVELTSLEGIENFPNLEEIHCVYCKLTSLKGIEHLTNLKRLSCRGNELTSLEDIENLSNLEEIDCRENDITSLNELIFLNRLTRLFYDEDKITLPNVLIRRLFRNGANVYNDSQNVHNTHIQKSLKDSIIKLFNTNIEEYNLDECIQKLDISEEFKNYIQLLDELFHDITFREILMIVFNKILKNENKDELIKILKYELKEGNNKCFVGKVTRIVNVLSGFDTDVSISISENEQKNIIAQKIFKETNSYEDYKEKFIKEMNERGFSDYDDWLNL